MSPGGKRSPRMLLLLLLYLLPLLLPFETPLFSLGPLVITSAELALYLVIAAWGVDLAVRRRGSWRGAIGLGPGDLLGRAAALWLAVVVISALLAPAHRAAAIKFALRSTTGVLLFFAARDLVRTPADARRLAGGVA